jgi:hypothetical protein
MNRHILLWSLVQPDQMSWSTFDIAVSTHYNLAPLLHLSAIFAVLRKQLEYQNNNLKGLLGRVLILRTIGKR